MWKVGSTEQIGHLHCVCLDLSPNLDLHEVLLTLANSYTAVVKIIVKCPLGDGKLVTDLLDTRLRQSLDAADER